MKIALISPSKRTYSETFIQAHKERLRGEIFYYYDGDLPSKLENGLVINSRRRRLIDLLKGHLRMNRFSLLEQALMSSFKKNKIEVVLAEFGGAAQRILPICRELNLPLVVHFHGYDASHKEYIRLNNYYQEVFEYAYRVLAVSKKMYDDLLQIGCPEEKLVYNVYGPREEFFNITPTFSKPQFIALGRFVDKKAPYYLILAFAEVVKLFPNARLVIGGDGELWNSCKNLIRHFGLDKKIFLPGIITKDGYVKYLEESLAMVQHSITAEDGDSEGTPVSILEASAAGLPVISTIHAGIPDIIIHGGTGFLSEEHDVMGMANNMISLLSSSSLAKTMGKQGKERIIKNFNLKQHISVLDSLLENAVKTKRSTLA